MDTKTHKIGLIPLRSKFLEKTRGMARVDLIKETLDFYNDSDNHKFFRCSSPELLVNEGKVSPTSSIAFNYADARARAELRKSGKA